MDLLRPVRLKGEPKSWDAYVRTLQAEQGGSCEWLARVARGEEPLSWSVPASLEAKVHPAGGLRPFWGDTVVFPIDAASLDACARLQRGLTEGLEPLFADPLDPQQFHITLHDLSNGPTRPPLEREMAENQEACRCIFREIREVLQARPELAEIQMQPVRMFDCLNISVLVGFAPASEQDYRLLLNLHEAFDQVQVLGYWLRPHVTLAYFKPRVPTQAEVEEFSRRLATLTPLPTVKLDVWELAYQHFQDMDRYTTRFTVRTA